MRKIIFTCLGPEKTYTIEEKIYNDGDVIEVSEEEYNKVVNTLKYAQIWTKDLEIRTVRLIESAKKKRSDILKKMEKRKLKS